MRKKILLILSVLLTLSVQAQKNLKLVEKSAKEKPDWIVNNSDYSKNYLMVQANQIATIEDAQNNVMASLLNQIASSVAVVVTGEMINSTNWETMELNGKSKDEFVQIIQNNTTTKIAKMPALQGISLIKAETYWEHYMDKKTKENFYYYYILYPFSSFELDELIADYNAQEKALNDKIDNYRNVLDELDEVDVMLENIEEMKSMMNEIGDGDPKYYKLKNNINSYENVIKNIYIDVLENVNGRLVLQLKYDEKVINTKKLPQLKGECARDFNKKHIGNEIEMTFNTFDCYEQDDNYVEVRFNFGKTRLVKKICIKL